MREPFHLCCATLALFGLWGQAHAQALLGAGAVGDSLGTSELFRCAAGPSGELVVGGSMSGSTDLDHTAGVYPLSIASGSDAILAKYDNNGVLVWGFNFGSTLINSQEIIQDLAVNDAGEVYVLGTAQTEFDAEPGAGVTMVGPPEVSPTSSAPFVLKYGPLGNLLWGWYLPTDFAAFVYTIEIAQNGDVLIGGAASVALDLDPGPANINLPGGMFVAAYDANGAFLWTIAGGAGAITGIQTDSENNLYVTGPYNDGCDVDPSIAVYALPSVGQYDVFFAKYNSQHAFVWAKHFGGLQSDVSNDIARSADGSLTVVGNFGDDMDVDPGPATTLLNEVDNHDGFIAHFDSTGVLLWAHAYSSTESDLLMQVRATPDHGLIACGRIRAPVDVAVIGAPVITPFVQNDDGFIVKYGLDGSLVGLVPIVGLSMTRCYSVAPVAGNVVAAVGMYNNELDLDPTAGEEIVTTPGENDDGWFALYVFDCAAPLGLDLGPDTITICLGEAITLSAFSPGSDFNWSPGGEGTSAITVSPTTTTTYSLVRGSGWCDETDSITVVVDPCMGIAQHATDVWSISPSLVRAGEPVWVHGAAPRETFTLHGTDVRTIDLDATRVSNDVRLDTDGLAPGMYILRGKQRAVRFVVHGT